METKGLVAIVTGASTGIGKAVDELFSQKGMNVVLVAQSKERINKLSQSLPDSLPIFGDVVKPEEIKKIVARTMEKYGKIDILVNNAGQGYDASVEKINISTFHYIFDFILVTPIIAMQEVIPIMRKQKKGIIVNVSSGTAFMVLEHMSPYASLKQALAKISLTAREDLKDDGIYVSVIYPYLTDTEFHKNSIHEEVDEGGYDMPRGNSPESVAQKLLEEIEKNEGEIIVYDWIGR